MTNELTIFQPQSVGTIAQIAPQAYQENVISHDRCLQFGQELLDRVKADGMSDSLDQEIATFIERAKKTLKKMNGKRSAVTQIFDSIRSVYTGLENEVDPAKKGTIPAQLQEARNRYAAIKRQEQEAELRKRQLEQARQVAKTKYTTDVEEDCMRQFNALVTDTINRLTELDKSLTLDNYATVADNVKNISDTLPQDWFDAMRPQVLLPPSLTSDEAHAIAAEVKQRLHQRFNEQFAFEISSTRDEIIDRLPSKRKELERIAQANAAEAERIRKALEERERREAEQRQRERAEREAKEKAAAELAAQKQEMDSLFTAAQLDEVAYLPKASVKQRINVLKPEGFMAIVGMWWSQVGCTLTVAELEKIFSKQLTFCNRLANDKANPIYVLSEHIEYVDDVKAK